MGKYDYEMKGKINVTQPSLPDLSKFRVSLQELWDSKTLTNNGPKVRELEMRLSKYLDAKHLVLYSSGTAAIMGVLFSLEKKGEIITSPFTFAATSNSVELCGSSAIFSDIDKKTLNLSPSKIESRITPNTLAVMPVACYGNTHGFREIREICDNKKLLMIADCAHSFGVQNAFNPLTLADYSILSFHATKVFSTVEGGAVICRSEESAERLREMRSFGIASQDEIKNIGFNGKMSELHALFGLLSLNEIDQNLAKRRKIEALYEERLGPLEPVSFQLRPNSYISNGSYMPIILDSNIPNIRDNLHSFLEDNSIFARKYFYPLASSVTSKRDQWIERFPAAETISNSVLCLPIFPDLHLSEVEYICDKITHFINEEVGI